MRAAQNTPTVRMTAGLARDQWGPFMEINWLEIFWAAMTVLVFSGLLSFVIDRFLHIGRNGKDKK